MAEYNIHQRKQEKINKKKIWGLKTSYDRGHKVIIFPVSILSWTFQHKYKAECEVLLH